MQQEATSGLVIRRSSHSVDEVVESLQAMLAAKGIHLFALVDHSGEAAKVGLSMRPTKLFIFGDPKAGTPLMLASITSAIDLPLKILVWEDEQGATQLAYNDPAYLGARHHIPETLLVNIASIEKLVEKLI
ncbi:DUF302 domain-containing protein [Terriglobus sp. ADX1]|uniref:DUF302 domain-containing protein n=1 Tax=Terriglobus sp. ADX1 TaxID=2794063 RepID=UPI002FE5E5E8